MVKDVQHRAFLVDTDLQPIEHRYVPDEHTEANRDEQAIGSNSYLIAKKMKSRPTRIMIRCPGVALATPVKE